MGMVLKEELGIDVRWSRVIQYHLRKRYLFSQNTSPTEYQTIYLATCFGARPMMNLNLKNRGLELLNPLWVFTKKSNPLPWISTPAMRVFREPAEFGIPF
jgi:hypothetical protein